MNPFNGPKGDTFEHGAEILAKRLLQDILEESCVVFIGAGSTTERSPHGRGFYETIKKQISHPESDPARSFPELMESFCKELDGGHHNRLIREAISYLERFSLPGEENRFATMVSNLLAEIPFFNRFVTTNWDPFVERSLDVLVPIVEDRDLAFWDDKKRQVLKIHGCITRPYSIVATQSDYDNCIAQNPLIFNKLKDLMATKSFVFMGYSMRDADFQEVWNSITNRLGRFGKLAYAIDPNATAENADFWRKRGIELFKTTDILFLRLLRNKLENEDLIPSQAYLRSLRRQRNSIASMHVKLSQETAGGFASSMYQDGLLHGLDDVLSSTELGIKRREDFERDMRHAAKATKQAKQKKDWIEFAYWTGRKEAVERFCDRDDSAIPPYFHPYKLTPTARLVKGDRPKKSRRKP